MKQIAPNARFGRLVFVSDGAPFISGTVRKRRRPTVIVRCDCGTEKTIDRYSFTSGNVASCGCLAAERPKNLRHGMYGTPIYASWAAMKARTTPGTAACKGRYVGVERDPRWDTFEGFMRHQPSGRKHAPGLQLARFGDEGPYSPENTRWATAEENRDEMLSRRKIRLPDGRFAVDVAKENGVPLGTWEDRYFMKRWPIEKAVSR